MKTTPEQRALDLRDWRVLDPNCEHKTHAYLVDLDSLESEVTRLRGLVERMKPYLLGQDHDERWNQLLSDLEKGAG